MHSDKPTLSPGPLQAMAAVSPDVANQIIDLFLSTGRERLDRMSDAADAGDWKRIHDLAHSIKGSSASVGAERLAAMASELERATAEGVESPALEPPLAELELEFRRAAEAALALRDDLGDPASRGVSG